MNVEASKLEVIQKLAAINAPELIAKINTLIDDEMIVGYTIIGEPLTREAYNARLQSAEADIESGRTITSAELKDRMNSRKIK